MTFPSSQGPGAATGALAQALRAVLILTPQEEPTERSFVPACGSPEALAASRAGNLQLADELEIAWRNAWRILPRVPAAEEQEQYGRGLELMAFEIQRGAGPCGETLIEWSWIQPCPRCWRRLLLRARCHKCSGSGWIGDERELFYADLDGNLAEAAG